MAGIPRAGIRAVQDQGVRIFDNHIDGSGVWGILTGFSTNVDIESNTVTGSIQQHGIYVGNSATNPIIRNNVVADNRDCGIQINSDATQGGTGIITGALVSGNIIFNNGVGGGAAINFDGVEQSTIEDNLIYNNHSAGIALYRHDGAAPPKDDTVVNNTIVMAENARWAISIKDDASGIYVGNNIILTYSKRNGGLSVDGDSKVGFTSDFNAVTDRFSADGGDSTLTLQDWQQATGQDSHSMLATPEGMFANLDKGDYHLVEASPEQNAGSPDHAPAKDIEGKTPIDAKHPAIGAYQRTGDNTAGGLVAPNWNHSLSHSDLSGKIWASAAAALGLVGIASVLRAAYNRNVHRWIGPYLVASFRPRAENRRKFTCCCVSRITMSRRMATSRRIARWSGCGGGTRITR